MDFVCMANDAYARWVELCVQALRQTHPGSTIHVYDLSEAQGEIKAQDDGGSASSRRRTLN
jgi:hypothetical protein